MSTDNGKRRKRRRHDGEATRAQILAAARQLFSVDGYDGVSLRRIAGLVGLDAAMVIRHFGSKDRLFAEAMRSPNLLHGVLADKGRERAGERLVRYAMSLEEDGREYHMLVALLRSASHKPAVRPLNDISLEAVNILAAWLDGANAETRAALIVSQLMGIFIQRSVFQNEALLNEEVEQIVAWASPAIQDLING